MKSYDYYESEIEEKITKNKNECESVDLCTKDFHAESYRFDEEINVCDDGSSG